MRRESVAQVDTVASIQSLHHLPCHRDSHLNDDGKDRKEMVTTHRRDRAQGTERLIGGHSVLGMGALAETIAG